MDSIFIKAQFFDQSCSKTNFVSQEISNIISLVYSYNIDFIESSLLTGNYDSVCASEFSLCTYL